MTLTSFKSVSLRGSKGRLPAVLSHLAADSAVYTWSALSVGCLQLPSTTLNNLTQWADYSQEDKNQY